MVCPGDFGEKLTVANCTVIEICVEICHTKKKYKAYPLLINATAI